MPLKYESMPKIIFCFTKDYLEELRKMIFALQVLPVLETHVRQMCFSQVSVSAHSARRQKETVPERRVRDATTKNYIYKLGLTCKCFLPLLSFCLKQ